MKLNSSDEEDNIEEVKVQNNSITISFNKIIYLCMWIVIFTLSSCYLVSELSTDYINIFPRSCITHTSRHYP